MNAIEQQEIEWAREDRADLYGEVMSDAAYQDDDSDDDQDDSSFDPYEDLDDHRSL